ncbi:MAG: hypothetical protein HQ508_00085 [Candidatus Marinimicrobia bacterium]|nr:hypothetical protein [Candidatus Neomarinimicrobiota bacterium]
MKYEQMRRGNQMQFGDFSLIDGQKNYAPDLKLEPIQTEIHLTVNLKERCAFGYALVTIRANVAGSHSLKLDAVDFDDLIVTDQGGMALKVSYDGKTITLTYDKNYSKNETRIVKIEYAIQDPISGLRFSQPDTHRLQLPLYAITDNETERARYWFPCIDFPNVRSKMEYFLTAPEDMTILANGALVDETNMDGMKTAHWKLDYPCASYLACFAIGEFSEYKDEPLRDIPIAYYADKSYTPEQLQRTFGATRKMLIWMEKKLGMAFPYPKYFQVAGREVGGAMENISLVTWDDKFMLDEKMAREWQYIMDLINVHEMSHSYFGDAVVSYDFAHVWLKESWATYIESVWLEDSEGQDAMDWQMAEEARSYIGEAKNNYVRPIISREYDHSWNMFDMHLYPGGAWRLHVLRKKVGDEKFWAGVQDYVNHYAGKTVKTLDFQRSIEKHSGYNLDSFFDMWFHSKGYPVLKVSFAHDSEQGRGKFTIEQTQMDKEKGIDVFEMDIEVAWLDTDGNLQIETIFLNKATQVVSLKMADPKHIILDPHMKALFEAEFNPGDDKLCHLLSNGKTVRGLMQAVSELGKTGKRKNLQAIYEYMQAETRWGLRIHVYRTLAMVGNDYAFSQLATLLRNEKDPMVIEEAAKACGAHKNSILRDAVLEKLKEADLPYRGQMALLESLGQQRDEGDIPLLKSYAQKSNWRNMVKAGAFLGLGSTRSEAALPTLLEDNHKPVHFWEEKVARLTALTRILDWLPKHLKKQAAQVICDATEDPSYFVKINAARDLGTAGIPEGLSYLNTLLTRLAPQDFPLMQRQIKKIQSSGDAAADKKLQKQVDELSEKLAKLEIRLQEVEAEK